MIELTTESLGKHHQIRCIIRANESIQVLRNDAKVKNHFLQLKHSFSTNVVKTLQNDLSCPSYSTSVANIPKYLPRMHPQSAHNISRAAQIPFELFQRNKKDIPNSVHCQ
ncbi:hypothetical protein VCUG_01644 [Vavraia culicis subsp. floridensis]|uniref:Uncharacterized protein n=1 Tax=Vavraia culicis (isolate floridensis) TaxID=948595 RepID=L2GUV9_VAVCU|nr:uncharacterized protein VCUG_01644 [Vavraia culicis subsp. floridensis]ELA46870.1 hypothetical protein VCUG_01644 [Vavraia culicis subsp. floridensis]